LVAEGFQVSFFLKLCRFFKLSQLDVGFVAFEITRGKQIGAVKRLNIARQKQLRRGLALLGLDQRLIAIVAEFV